ncbi:SAM-dependent methyltransferase [Streptomyces crystallinus]|uniref:Uncharacterized protein n=1 Tax=Streptomyces crystallinus TaxID=68191 RepID=A0ABN1GIQ7_9ACTN
MRGDDTEYHHYEPSWKGAGSPYDVGGGDSFLSPNPARVCHWLSGGRGEFRIGAASARRLAEIDETVRTAAVNNRLHGTLIAHFLAERGFAQILDLGCGYAHDWSRALRRRETPLLLDVLLQATIVHVEIDGIVAGRAQSTMSGLYGNPRVFHADIRLMPGVLAHPQIEFQEAVTESLLRLRAVFPYMPVIVAGDLNVIERGHQPAHKVFGQWEYAFYDSFQSAGLTDAFRHLHPDKVDHSWFGRSGNGFRFDHLFFSTRHAVGVLACDYHQEPREAGLTDHAVMMLRLGLPSTRGGEGEAPL